MDDGKVWKEFCLKKWVQIGYREMAGQFEMENTTGVVKMKLGLQGDPIIRADYGTIGFRWQHLDSFFKAQGIVQNWSNCNNIAGIYDEELGRWTGCVGKVKDMFQIVDVHKYIIYFI